MLRRRCARIELDGPPKERDPLGDAALLDQAHAVASATVGLARCRRRYGRRLWRAWGERRTPGARTFGPAAARARDSARLAACGGPPRPGNTAGARVWPPN